MHENKQNAGKMSCQMSDIYVEVSRILRATAAIWGQIGSNQDFLERIWTERTMNFRQPDHSGMGRRTAKRAREGRKIIPASHDMYETKSLRGYSRHGRKILSDSIKSIYIIGGSRLQEKGGIKNEG